MFSLESFSRCSTSNIHSSSSPISKNKTDMQSRLAVEAKNGVMAGSQPHRPTVAIINESVWQRVDEVLIEDLPNPRLSRNVKQHHVSFCTNTTYIKKSFAWFQHVAFFPSLCTHPSIPSTAGASSVQQFEMSADEEGMEQLPNPPSSEGLI